MSELLLEDSPQILFSTTNITVYPDDEHSISHQNVRLVGQRVIDAGFDGITLYPQGIFKDNYRIIESVLEGSLIVGSLRQGKIGFDMMRGEPDNHEEDEIRQSYKTNTRELLWRDSLSHFFELQRTIGQRPATIYSRANRQLDTDAQEIVWASSYAVPLRDPLAAAWGVKSIDELIAQAHSRGYSGFSLDMRRPVTFPLEVPTAVDDPVIDTTNNVFSRVIGSVTEIGLSFIKNREYDGTSFFDIDEVVAVLQKGHLPRRMRSLAKLAMTQGAVERVRLDLAARDLYAAIAMAEKTTDDQNDALWAGYSVIGEAMRRAFSA